LKYASSFCEKGDLTTLDRAGAEVVLLDAAVGDFVSAVAFRVRFVDSVGFEALRVDFRDSDVLATALVMVEADFGPEPDLRAARLAGVFLPVVDFFPPPVDRDFDDVVALAAVAPRADIAFREVVFSVVAVRVERFFAATLLPPVFAVARCFDAAFLVAACFLSTAFFAVDRLVAAFFAADFFTVDVLAGALLVVAFFAVAFVPVVFFPAAFFAVDDLDGFFVALFAVVVFEATEPRRPTSLAFPAVVPPFFFTVFFVAMYTFLPETLSCSCYDAPDGDRNLFVIHVEGLHHLSVRMDSLF